MRLEISAPPNGRPAADDGEAAPADQAMARTPPGAEPAARPSSAGDLPEIAKKADDLEAIKKAVDEAAAVGGGLWLSYLFVLFYLAVAAGAVTHVDPFPEKLRWRRHLVQHVAERLGASSKVGENPGAISILVIRSARVGVV